MEEGNIEMATARPKGQRRRLALTVIFVGVALAFGARWLEAQRQIRAAHPTEEGILELPGLRAELDVVRDRNGVPHVRAEHASDAWMAVGFVQAQDRLGQMLWLRRLARGEAAEWAGAEALPADRWARTLDFGGLADRDLARASSESRQVLSAFAAGINAWLARAATGEASLPAGVPVGIEHVAAWTASDSLAIAKLRAWQLADVVDETLTYEAVVRQIGPIAARGFFPSQRDTRPPPTRADFRAPPSLQLPDGPVAPLRRFGGLAGPHVGSAAWVVSGRFTRRGSALLAGDLHAPPQIPAPVYEVHVRAPGIEVAGAMLPGVPIFWAGFNGDVAWSATHAPALVMDLVEETLFREDPSRVMRGRRWRSLDQREETIRVRGAANHTEVVRSTQGRPLVEELLGADRPLSLRWTGQRVGGIDGFVALSRARSSADVERAMARHREPLIALAWVASESGGGVRVAGAAPAREVASGFQPVPAGNPSYDWAGFLDPDELPSERLGPARPWAIAAGRAPLRGSGRLEPVIRLGPERARIEERLQLAADDGPIDLAVLVDLQRDTAASGARAIVGRALALAGELSHEEAEIADLLRDWDGNADLQSRGAAAYHVFSRRLSWAVLESAVGHAVAHRMFQMPRMEPDGWLADALAWAAHGGSPEQVWTAPAHLAPMVRESLQQTWLRLSVDLGANRDKWRWGRLHSLRFRPLWRGAWPDPLGIGPFPIGGSRHSVAQADLDREGTGEVSVVSAYRFAVDAGNLDQALTQIAPGQSEHPGHRHAQDRLDGWRRGQPSLLSTSDPVVEDGPVARLKLVPPPDAGAP